MTRSATFLNMTRTCEQAIRAAACLSCFVAQPRNEMLSRRAGPSVDQGPRDRSEHMAHVVCYKVFCFATCYAKHCVKVCAAAERYSKLQMPGLEG
jgi:hypothetical protein